VQDFFFIVESITSC